MYQALYRKWRPAVFDDVYGQEHITSILKSEVMTGKISHAYLFCGPRGTGKTTCAKIIAKAANCENPAHGNPCGVCDSCKAFDSGNAPDIIEMDAASNNGVDNIRELRDGIAYTPAEMKYRVYIIDEVHMLSISAFNALLKTLEEPPKYVIFVLATTELHKIPATVLSRCQRFDFRRVTPSALIDRMKVVCNGEGIKSDDESLELIARLSQGSFRDALNMLEFCSGEAEEITIDKAERLLGASSAEVLSALVGAVCDNDISASLEMLNEIYLSSKDITVFWRELISFLRDILIASVTKDGKSAGSVSELASRFAPSRLIDIIRDFTDVEADMVRNPGSAKLYAEIALIRATDVSVKSDASSLASRVSKLEDDMKKLSSGGASFVRVEREEPIARPVKVEKKPVAAEPENLAKEETKKDAPVLRAGETGTSMKALRGWTDIVRNISYADMSISPSLYGARALESTDGRLYILFDNIFPVNIINSSQTSKSLISDAVRDVTGKEYSPEMIVVDLKKNAEETTREPIDDIIEKINEGE